MNYNIIQADNIRKKYGKNTILSNVSIHIKQGEIYGLVGKNGSGKTTLLRILTGQIQKYDGTVTVGKINNQKCKISAVINSPALFLNMTAIENMTAQALLFGINDNEKNKKILKTVGLEEFKDKKVSSFSLGMTQRLKIGMALLKLPDILILDEPINGLDPGGIADLRKLLFNLNKEHGITILISSHILSELEHIATCFGVLSDGNIVKEISTIDVFNSESTLEKLYMQYTRGGKS